MAKATSQSPTLPQRPATRAGRTLIHIAASSVVLALLAALATLVTSAPRVHLGEPGSQSPAASPQESFTSDERARIGEQALAHLRTSGVVKDQRLRVLSVKGLAAEKDATGAQRPSASVVVFNYSQGNATRLVIDPSNGAVLREERLRGRPQASEEEKQDAERTIRADPEHARLLDAGVLEGGFIVDDPARKGTHDRFIQFQILTRDRQNFQRFVTVNLTAGSIAESKQR